MHKISNINNGWPTRMWRIFFEQKPTEEEIFKIIEERYPPEGYGVSSYRGPIEKDGGWSVTVITNHSCD